MDNKTRNFTRRVHAQQLSPLSAMIRLAATIAAALFWSTAAFSATPTVDQRSPLSQGAWWYPARSGSGFEIFTVGESVAVLWYTFTTSGKPTWYLAQGSASTLGSAWPLVSYRWDGGRQSSPTQEGTLRLSVQNPEAAEVEWRLGQATGKWPIQPLGLSGIINEVDRSGAWFNPDQPGWGISLIEQGNVTAGALYTYDREGAPTWFSGSAHNRPAIDLRQYTGSCPDCVMRPSQSVTAGRLNFNYQSEAALTLVTSEVAGMSPLITLNSASLRQISRPASARLADRQLAAYPTEALLKQQLDAGMLNIAPTTMAASVIGITFSVPPVGASSATTPSFSTTNVQEAGVDEADWLKFDGTTIYTYKYDANGKRQPAIRRARVDAKGINVASEIPLATHINNMAQAGLYLAEGRLISVSGIKFANTGVIAPWITPNVWRQGETHVEVFDSTGESPRQLWKADIEGHLVASRRVGNRLIVVTRHVPSIAGFQYGAYAETTIASNRALLAATPLNQLLPYIKVNDQPAEPLLKAQQVWAPPQGARKFMADMVVVTVINLATPAIQESLAVLGTLDTLYASPTHLVLTGSRSPFFGNITATLPLPEPSAYFTDLHQIRIDGAALKVSGSATVEGFIDNRGENAPFRLSEQNGRLRIVTSSSNMWGGGNRNRLTILEPSTISPGLLKTVSYLPNDARPAPLGKPGELLYGTRFHEDRLYAVTFRRVDPLYVVDLENPADPAITGELEVLGYSEYLHPLPGGLLLGFGRDALPAQTPADGPFAWFQGLQFSLFDTSDKFKPRELKRILIGNRGSTSALSSSHLAFTSLRNADGSLSIGIPAVLHNSGPNLSWTSNVNMTYPWSHTGLLRFKLSGNSAADVRLEQEETLVTHSLTTGTSRPIESYGLTARAIMIGLGIVYVDNGRFWTRDSTGSVQGPF
ncbi:MAG: beta-propeller domain-containing protein [Betaproteobacteria bacterium]|nr:beta-propeller domain-containing protein [Betaproteobacteria bacterium]